jgi:hypothetical protein
MAFDAARERVLLFGGRDVVGRYGKSLDDTWEWDGVKWMRVNLLGPSRRDHHAMCYDSARKRIVLFGGGEDGKFLGDTWEWDGKKWIQINAPNQTPRAKPAMAYMNHRRVVLMYGGAREGRVLLTDIVEWNGKRWEKVN